MPSKFFLINAHILLETHKCETCPDLLAIFKPYNATSNAEYQQTWYQKSKEKHAEYDKKCALNFAYQKSNKKSSQKYHMSKKFPPSAELYQNIVSDFWKEDINNPPLIPSVIPSSASEALNNAISDISKKADEYEEAEPSMTTYNQVNPHPVLQCPNQPQQYYNPEKFLSAPIHISREGLTIIIAKLPKFMLIF